MSSARIATRDEIKVKCDEYHSLKRSTRDLVDEDENPSSALRDSTSRSRLSSFTRSRTYDSTCSLDTLVPSIAGIGRSCEARQASQSSRIRRSSASQLVSSAAVALTPW